MDKQKLTGIIMVPVVAIACFVAYRSYKANLGPDPSALAVPSKGQSAGGGGMGGGGGQKGPTPAQMMDTMAKELTLSADQKTKISAIQDDVAAKRKAFPKDMAREQRRAEMTKLRAAADVKIKALLSPEQQKKYDAMQAKRRAQMQARGGGAPNAGGPATTR